MPAQRIQTNEGVSGNQGYRVSLRAVSLLLIVFGIGVSGYLSYVKFTNVEMVCIGEGTFRCDVVQNSVYSEIGGVAIAYLGLATYLVLGALHLLENRGAFMREYAMLFIFGLTLFAWIYSMYLVYVQAVILGAYCQWCLTHELIITILFIVTIVRLRRHISSVS